MDSYLSTHTVLGEDDWGVEEFTRVCGMIIDSNTNILQQVVDNKTNLLDLLTYEQLCGFDDLGLNTAFLAVYYDRPDILRYLIRRGVDLRACCDPMNYGTPVFYAESYNKPLTLKLLRDHITELEKQEQKDGETVGADENDERDFSGDSQIHFETMSS
jgi:hypothetical protein